MLRMLGPHGGAYLLPSVQKKYLKNMAFLGGVFCPYPCWSMSTIPPYKTTQVVVNMEHSDVTCKIITQSGNHQYNHSQSL